MNAAPPRLWLLMSNHVGDNTQLLALAAALGFPYEVKRLSYRPLEWLPRMLLGATLLGVAGGGPSQLAPPYPDLVIGAGRHTEAVAMWIRQHLNPSVRLVYVGTPWASPRHFDLVIATPQYRLPPHPHVLHNALPLHDIWPDRLAAAARIWEPRLAHLPKPWTALLVGGGSGPYRFGAEAATRLARQASERANARRGALLVTTSARTSEAASEALFAGLTAPAFEFRWRGGDGPNPFHAFLALADDFIVTADSISMIAEACATAKPTFLFDIETGRRSMRAEEMQGGGTARLPPPYWRGADFSGTLWRLAMAYGPDSWTRDLRIVHRQLIAEGRAAWLGSAAAPARSSDASVDMDRAIARIRSILGTA